MASILVVDDLDSVRLSLQKILGKHAHEVATAADGEQALDLMDGNTFDLVITDVAMPKLDGIGLIKSLRQTATKQKILAISGGSPQLPADPALSLSQAFGANAILYKPFTTQELIDAVDDLLVSDPAG